MPWFFKSFWFVLGCIVAIMLYVTCIANGQTINYPEVAKQLRGLIQEQRLSLEQTEAALAESRHTADALYGQLGQAQTDMKLVGSERDGWKKTAQTFEVTVEKQAKRILQLYIIIGALVVAIAAYIGLRLHPATRMFIP